MTDKASLSTSNDTPVRHELFGVPVDAVDMDGALAHVERLVEHGTRPGLVLAVNPEKVVTLNERQPELLPLFKRAELLIPDGIGVVWALDTLHGATASRTPGADLMQAICARAAERGWGVFLYGSKEAVSLSAAQKLVEQNPALKIVGRENGYVPPEKMDDLIAAINASGARVLFVALGSPRQELWMREHADKLDHVRVIQGIGGTLDTIAGTVKRAPWAFQKLGLEWFYRMLRQPRTRIPRNRDVAVFALRVLGEKLKRTR